MSIFERRDYSYDALGSFVAVPVAQITAGPIAVAIGTTHALLAAAAIMTIATVVMIVNRSIRGLHSPALDLEPQLDPSLDPQLATAA